MPRVEYHPQAKRDLADAASYYADQRPGLKRDFLDEIWRCRQQIVQFPESGAAVLGEVRRKLLTSYPYELVYRIEPGGDIHVIAVAHLKRKPLYWLGRE